MKSPREKMLRHYADEARTHGTAGTATIRDMRVRDIEVAAIRGYLRAGERVRDISCGNGFTVVTVARGLDVAIDAFDLKAIAAYDVAYTEHALQNLLDGEEQARALAPSPLRSRPAADSSCLSAFAPASIT